MVVAIDLGAVLAKGIPQLETLIVLETHGIAKPRGTLRAARAIQADPALVDHSTTIRGFEAGWTILDRMYCTVGSTIYNDARERLGEEACWELGLVTGAMLLLSNGERLSQDALATAIAEGDVESPA